MPRTDVSPPLCEQRINSVALLPIDHHMCCTWAVLAVNQTIHPLLAAINDLRELRNPTHHPTMSSEARGVCFKF